MKNGITDKRSSISVISQKNSAFGMMYDFALSLRLILTYQTQIAGVAQW
jgi:hypothetical protein